MTSRAWMIVLLLAAGCLEKIDPGRQPYAPPVPTSDGGVPADLMSAPADSPEDLSPAASNPIDMAQPPLLMMMEAEGGTLTAPMASVSDANASGGSYIAVAATDTTGSASFNLTIPTTGTYYFWGRAAGPTDTSNSFHVTLDADPVDNDASDGASSIWDLPVDPNLTWQHMNHRTNAGNDNLAVMLTAGAHTLVITTREGDTHLDKILVTDSAGYTPTN